MQRRDRRLEQLRRSRCLQIPTNTPVRLPCRRSRHARRPPAPPRLTSEQQPLLRVQAERFARSHAEKLRIELVCAVDEAAAAGPHFARSIGVRVVVGIDVPTVRRHLANGIDPVFQQPPERFRIVGPARKAACHADDGDRFRQVGRRCGDRAGVLGLPLSFAQSRQGLFQEVIDEGFDGRIVDRHGLGQRTLQAAAQPISQLDRGERVHPQVEEALANVDRMRFVQPQHAGDVAPHVSQQQRALRFRSRFELNHEFRSFGRRCGGAFARLRHSGGFRPPSVKRDQSTGRTAT